MSTREILNYYDCTENKKTREDLVFAQQQIKQGVLKVAIDCGCGAGSDIAYLRKHDFTVYAFDIESDSINRCQERFKKDNQVLLSKDSFVTFQYPQSSIIVADASLFFCPKDEFSLVWNKITDSLIIGGIFCGSFLGPNDTMATPYYNKDAYWPDILVLDELSIKEKFTKYDILKWTEHELSGESQDGIAHHWHIFSVVARKISV